MASKHKVLDAAFFGVDDCTSFLEDLQKALDRISAELHTTVRPALSRHDFGRLRAMVGRIQKEALLLGDELDDAGNKLSNKLDRIEG